MMLSAAPDATFLRQLGERALALEQFANNSTVHLELSGQEFDGDGEVKQRSLAKVKVTRKAGARDRVLEHYEENGVEMTEKKRKEMAKEKEKEDSAQRSPFHPDEQSHYMFSQLEAPAGHPEWVRISFSPASEKLRGEKVMEGEAWVDVAATQVRRLWMRPSKLPSLVEKLSIECELDAQTPVGLSMSKMTVKGVAGALFFKKRFTVVTTFRDYASE